MRIARSDPRKAGEDHAACQLGKQPQRSEQQRIAHRSLSTPANEKRHRRGEVERQEHAQAKHRERRHPRRQPAVAVHADEQPPGARTQPCGTEQKAEQRRALRIRRRHAPRQRADTDELQPPSLGVNVGERVQRAERGGEQQVGGERKRPRPLVADQARHQPPSLASASSDERVTLNQRTAPPRVSITVKCSPPRLADSPRRGTRPSSWATRPPMVSKWSVGSLAANDSLTAPISASPATRWLPSASV